MEQPHQTEGTPGFCPDCGSIIPPMKSMGGSICYLCQKEHDVSGENFVNLTKLWVAGFAFDQSVLMYKESPLL